MNRIFRFCLLALISTGVGNVQATTPLEDAFTDLVEGRLDEAGAGFDSISSGQQEGRLGAWHGRFLHSWAVGDLPGVAEALSVLIAEFPGAPMLPAWLAASSQSLMQGWTLDDREAVLRNALENNPPEPNRTLVLQELAQILDMQLDDEASQLAKEAGVLIDDWHVVGPFGRHGSADFRFSFGPEHSWEASYEGWLGEVSVEPVHPVSPVGMIFPEALVTPQNGMVYWINVVEAEEGGEAILNVRCREGLRLWWNGRPLAEKSEAYLHTANQVSVAVKVREGRNLLVMKTPYFANGWFQASLIPQEAPLAWNTVPFRMEEWENTWLRPFEITHSQPFVSSGLHSDYPLSYPTLDAPTVQSIRDVTLGIWHLDREEFDAAIEHFDQARTRHPEFWLAHTLYGEASREFANARPGSRTRLLQQAEAAFQHVLEGNPSNSNAFIGQVSYHLDLGQTESAMEFIREHLEANPQLAVQTYMGMTEYVRAVVLAEKGFQTEAQHILTPLLQGFLPSLDVYNRLFDTYRQGRNHEKAADLIDDALAHMPIYPSFVQRAQQLRQESIGELSLLEFLKTRMDRHPQAIRYALDVGETLESLGRLDEALAHYQKLNEQFPRVPAILARLARLHTQLGNKNDGLNLYEQWYDEQPRSMEAFRALREGDEERVFPYEKYDVQLGDIDVTEAQRWSDTRASGIYLLDIMVLEIHKDGTYDQYIHQAIQVLNQDGIRRWAEVVIPRGPNVELLQARTITPQGLVWDVFNVQDVGGQQSLSMFGVEPGAIIEYAYLERTGRSDPGLNVYSGGYFFGSDNDPMLLSQLTIIRPEDFPFHIDRNPETFVAEERREDGRIISTWINRLQDGLKSERFAPPLAERVPSLQWTTGRDWNTFVERLRFSLFGVEEASPLIAEKAAGFSVEEGDAAAVVQQVYDFVRTEIETGGGGQTTVDTLVMNAGTEYGKLMLARQLIEEQGIDTQVVAVMDNEEDDGFRPLPFPSYPARVMLNVPEQPGIDEAIVFDFNNRFTALGELPGALQKQVALKYEDPAPYVDPLYPALWENGRLERDITLTVLDDRSASVDGEYRYGHGFDAQIRELLTNPEVKDRLADAQLTQDFRGIQVGQADILYAEDVTRWPVLSFRGQIPDFVTPSGAILEINPVVVRSSAADYISEPTREFPLTFSSSPTQDPLKITVDLSVFLKEDTTIVVPDDVLMISEFGFYSLYYEWNEGGLEVRKSLLIPPQTIEPERYSMFVDFCREIDRLESRPIEIHLWSN